MDTDSKVGRDKPWRPVDYPAPGPSWETQEELEEASHRGTPDAED